MRIRQPVSTPKLCEHCKGSGKCLCKKVCAKLRPQVQAVLDEAEVDLQLAPPQCTVCLGRGNVQVWKLVLGPPNDTARVRRPSDRSKRAQPTSPSPKSQGSGASHSHSQQDEAHPKPGTITGGIAGLIASKGGGKKRSKGK
ncbi:MAG: hypothetical protein HYT31_02655 [Parcubacteria group bacterium]|nr:hypothetical protein [Parcubacteria group bacterium]